MKIRKSELKEMIREVLEEGFGIQRSTLYVKDVSKWYFNISINSLIRRWQNHLSTKTI